MALIATGMESGGGGIVFLRIIMKQLGGGGCKKMSIEELLLFPVIKRGEMNYIYKRFFLERDSQGFRPDCTLTRT